MKLLVSVKIDVEYSLEPRYTERFGIGKFRLFEV